MEIPDSKDRLESWKEIAAFLKRDVRTVQRWEKREGLPVHRHFHEKLSTVDGSKSELQAWWLGRHDQLEGERVDTTSDVTVEVAGRRSRLWVATFLLILTLAGLALWRIARVEAVPRPAMQVVPLTTYNGIERYPSFSPDGKQIAFTWNGEKQDNFDVYVKLLEPGTALRLTDDPAEELFPTWSPEGRWIAFLRPLSGTTQGVYLVPALGGPERKLGEVSTPPLPNFPSPFLTWTPDGKGLIVVDHSVPEESFSLFLLSVESGEKRPLTHAPRKSYGDSSPSISPDRQKLAFVRLGQGHLHSVYVQSLAQDFSARGEPKLLTSAVGWGISNLNWTADGSAILCVNWFESDRGIWRIPLSGSGSWQPVTPIGGAFRHLTISRQGDRLAYTQENQDPQVWRLELPPAGRKPARPTRLTSFTRVDGLPAFSLDGRRMAFDSQRSGHSEIWASDMDGSKPVRLTYFDGPLTGSARWSPDGKQIAFDCSPGGNLDIYVVSADGGKPRRLTTDPANDNVPSWSHDGRWIYFSSSRTGEFQIWKVPARGGDALQVTRQGSDRTVFESADGRFLYYRKGEPGIGSIWRVPTEGGEERKIVDYLWRSNFAVEADGIYFMSERRPAESYALGFCRFSDLQTEWIATIDQRVSGAFVLSPDRRAIVYRTVEPSGGDILMVENFR